jgi:hypothetical protein
LPLPFEKSPFAPVNIRKNKPEDLQCMLMVASAFAKDCTKIAFIAIYSSFSNAFTIKNCSYNRSSR